MPTLRAAKGSIVNVASILGLGGRGAGLSLYCASKGGVVNLTRDAAIELAPDIRVPGSDRVPRIDGRPAGRPYRGPLTRVRS